MRLLQSAIIGTLATIGAAMAQPAPAPAVSLDEAARGLIALCADYAGNAQTSLSEEQIDSLNSLGIEARPANFYMLLVPTTAGGMAVSIVAPRGSCMINRGGVPTAAFAAAFSAAFDGSDGYERDTRAPLPEGVARWRGQRVEATMRDLDNGSVMVRISQAFEARASRE